MDFENCHFQIRSSELDLHGNIVSAPDNSTEVSYLQAVTYQMYVSAALYQRISHVSGRTDYAVTGDFHSFSFCILAAVSTYLLFLGTTNGIVRFYLLVSEITGAAVYTATAGRLFGCVSGRISFALSVVISRLFSPFARLAHKTRIAVAEIKAKLDKKLKKSKNKLKKCLKDTK